MKTQVELAVEGQITREMEIVADSDVCTMCGDYCANRAFSALFKETLNNSMKA